MFEGPKDLLAGPALPPPPGVIAHFSRTSPDQKWFYICVPLFTIIPGIFILLRLYTKLKIVRKLDLSDYFILSAFVIFIVDLSLATFTLSYGVGVHQWNLRRSDFMRQVFWLNIGEALYCPSIFFIKSAIVLQYIQILAPVRMGNGAMYYGGWSVITAMFLFYSADIFLTLFICVPREKIWNMLYDGGKCMDYNALVVASAAFNIITDFFILLLPAQAVWRLRINKKKKFAVCLLFATGIFATLASCMRFPYMFRLQEQGENQDQSYEMAWMGLWSWAEIALGIMIACTLTMPKLVRARSDDINSFFTRISQPFVSIKVRIHTSFTKTTMHKSGLTKIESHELNPQTSPKKAPRIKDVVHAPPGLTLDSGNLSFVRAEQSSV